MQTELINNVNVPIFHPLILFLIGTKSSKACKSAFITTDNCLKEVDNYSWLPLTFYWTKKYKYVKDFLKLLDNNNFTYIESRGENGIGRTGKPLKYYCIKIKFSNFLN